MQRDSPISWLQVYKASRRFHAFALKRALGTTIMMILLRMMTIIIKIATTEIMPTTMMMVMLKLIMT